MFWWLAQNTLLAGVLALAAALAGRFGRLSPAVRHALWLVVLVKLVTPPLAFYSLPEGEPWAEWLAAGPPSDAPRQTTSNDESPPPAAATSAAELSAFDLSQPAKEESIVEILEFPLSELQDSSEIEPQETAGALTPILLADRDEVDAELSPRKAANHFAVGAATTQAGTYAVARLALVGLWAFGAAWMAGLQAARLMRLCRLLRVARAAPESLTALVAEIAAQLGVAPPKVQLTSTACSPMIFAWGRVRLVWPESLAEPFDAEARRAVIAHELAHLRRRDHWVGWIELAASCGWWWNPLFWYVRRQLRETAELACDAWVVELLPGGRRAYAQALIEVSEMISWTAAPAPAVGMGASARHLFERRLTMILRERVPCRAPLIGLALIGLLGIAVLPGWTKGQAPTVGSPAADLPADSLPADSLPADSLPADSLPAADLPAAEAPANGAPRAGATASGLPAGAGDPVSDTNLKPEPSLRPAEKKNEPARETPSRGDAPVAGNNSPDGVWVRGPALENAVREGKLAEIKQLEARLAALAEELRALRGAEESTRGKLPKIGYRAITSATNKVRAAVANPYEDRLSAIMLDVPEGGGQQELKLALFADQRIHLRLPFKTTFAKAVVDPPDVVKIVEHNPHELVLLALHPGQAVGRFWDDHKRAYVVHADVLGPEAGRPAEKDHAFYYKLGFDDRKQADSSPGYGSDVETLTRAKYKLPPGRAAALAAFIKEHVKEDVETKVDGDTLVVTAASDDQARIGQFLQLLKKTPERTETEAHIGASLPAGRSGEAPAANSGLNRAAPLPAQQQSGPKGPLPSPGPDAVPRGANTPF